MDYYQRGVKRVRDFQVSMTNLGLLVYSILAALSFCAVVIGTPLPAISLGSNKYTIWRVSGGPQGDETVYSAFSNCNDLYGRFIASEIAAALTIITTGAAIITALCFLFYGKNLGTKYHTRDALLFLTLFDLLLLTIAWGTIADARDNVYCGISFGSFHYREGFALFLVGWSFLILAFGALLLLPDVGRIPKEYSNNSVERSRSLDSAGTQTSVRNLNEESAAQTD